MKKALAMALALVASAGLFADEYYVDANYGRDDDPAYDGTAPDKAKKTLAEAMKLAAKGDTVWAAEGDYNDGEMLHNNSYLLRSRVVVPEGVSLIASGRQSETFITGRAASGDGIENATYGLGYNALRCVYLKKNAKVRGFTCRNGHTRGTTDASGAAVPEQDRYGAGILTWAEPGTYAENCRVIGCVADHCIAGYARFINCAFLSCTNNNTGVNVGFYGYYCNCLFDHNRGGRVTMYAPVLLNCTLGPDNRSASGTSAVDAMWGVAGAGSYDYSNLLVVQQGSGNGGAQTDCILDNTKVEKHTVYEETHVTFMKAAEMGLDGDLVPMRDSPANGYCTTGVFAAMYEKHFPGATEKWYEVTDLKGNPRISNGILDAGCYEFDWRPVFAKDLSASFVEVSAASSNVTETAEKKVALGAGAELSVVWTSPFGDETEYSFTVEVTGSGTLRAYVDDEAEPVVTATEGVRTLSFTRSGDRIAVRLVYEGDDGEAVLSSFQNAFTASISIPDKGIAMTGSLTEPGDYVITEPTTFTLTRTFDSTHLCTGFTTNGVYVAWDDLPGETWTWTVESKATSVRIAAVYMEHQTWHVDPVNGDDANTGFLPNQAKKTLLVALTNDVVTAGDTVLAFPGTYDKGGLLTPGTAETITNRVYVPAGVTLKSRDGAAVTHIVGQASPNPTHANYGLGPGAVRCVCLGEGAVLEGFTLREGHTHHEAAAAADNYYGAIKSAGGTWIVDCVVSNCYGSWQSVTSGGSAVRSKFVACNGVNYDACLSGGNYYNCYFGDLTGSYGIYSPDILVNCTLGASGGGIRYPGDGGSPCYNCVIAGPIHQGGAFHRCIIAKESYSAASDHLYDADCITNIPLAQLKLDAADDYRPLAGSPAVDFGCNDYLGDIPGKYRVSAYPSGQRVYNGAVDAGAHEYDIRGDLGKVLLEGQVAVDAASGGVSNETSEVAIPAGDEMSVTWTPSALETTRFAFKVAFTGADTLKGYADGATEPAFTVTEDGLVTYDRAGQTPLRLRLVVEGEGAVAHVSGFSNIDAAYILPADGGMVVTGANLGTNLVAAGQRLNFTIRRAYDSTRLSTGFTVDGVAYSWDDYPDGWTHTVDGDDRSTTVLIGATYLDEGQQNWYVDAVNGSDSNRGLAPENAKLTLADACTNTPVVAGETIWLAPGLYTNGTIAISGKKTLNRAVLPAGVVLASTSGRADDTFVVGAPTPADEQVADNGAFGEGCVRVLYLNGGNVVSNVTLCGGYAYAEKTDLENHPADESVAAAYVTGDTSYFVGCVISNNQAKITATANDGVYIRCRICANTAKWYAGLSDGSYYNCLIYGNQGAYPLHNPVRIVGCTLGPNGEWSSIRSVTPGSVYNTLIYGPANDPIAKVSFYRTYYVAADFKSDNMPAVWADGSKTNAVIGELELDATKTPVKGHCEVMEAANADYLALFPAKFAHEALVDFYGNPRVLGGAPDIGAVEYDWRKDFAADLGGRLLVPMASSNVVETAEKAVRLTGGQSLSVAFTNADKAKVGRTFPVTVSGGTLTVTVNGEVVASLDASGEWRYEEGATDDVIVFSFAASEDGGFADLARSRSNRGVLLLVR